MTRETKVGLVVAGSFICLVAVVVAAKFQSADPAAQAQAAAEPGPKTPDDKDKPAKKKDEHKPAGPSDHPSSVKQAQHQERLAIPAVKSDPVEPPAVPPSLADMSPPANFGALPPAPPMGENNKGPRDRVQQNLIEQKALADAKNGNSTSPGAPTARVASMSDGLPPPSLPDQGGLLPPPVPPVSEKSDKDKDKGLGLPPPPAPGVSDNGPLKLPPPPPAPGVSDNGPLKLPPPPPAPGASDNGPLKLPPPPPAPGVSDNGPLKLPPPPPIPNTAQIQLSVPGTGKDAGLPPPPPPPVGVEPGSNPAMPPPPPLGAGIAPKDSKIAPIVQLPGSNNNSLGGLPGSMPPPPLGGLPGSTAPGSIAPTLATPVPATGSDPQGHTRPIGAVSSDVTHVTPYGSDAGIPPLGAAAPPLGRKTPRPGEAMPQVTESAIHPHQCGADERSFTAVSKKVFNDEKYGPALARFNSELQPKREPGEGKTVLVPSREFLEKNFPETFAASVPLGLQPAVAVDQRPNTISAKPLEKPFPDQTPPPLGAAPSLGGNVKSIPLESFSRANTGPGPMGEKDAKLPTKTAVTSNGPKEYHVAAEGENILDIAAKTLGDSGRWPEIYRLNGGINPTYPIQGGTTLRLPPSAVVPR